jgi:hypothetical protein
MAHMFIYNLFHKNTDAHLYLCQRKARQSIQSSSAIYDTLLKNQGFLATWNVITDF